MGDHIVDVETSIQLELDSLVQYSSKHWIQKVPEYISKVKKQCYEPSIVSIGPLHYNNPTLKPFDETKLRSLQYFLENANSDHSLAQYIDIIRGSEEKIRSYYTDKITLESDEFIKMVMVDSTFIIVFFMHCSHQFSLKPIHPMENKLGVVNQVKKDLLLGENQLPYFILQDLYDKAFGETCPKITFKNLTCDFLSFIYLPASEVVGKIGREKIKNASNIKHLVDFYRICCLPTKHRDQLPENYRNSDKFPPTAKELKAAGVKFTASDGKNLLDIVFSDGVLHIPSVKIQNSTEAIVRNIMFFEQCFHSMDSYFVDYVLFLDTLIDTPEDVHILIEAKIIKNCLGSIDDMAATFFNQATKHVALTSRFYYANVGNDLNAHVSKRWNRYKAALRRDYFNHPWSIMSLIYLMMLLILTVLQVYTGFVH
ncbi:UPF0481 protein At3g47200-like [Beta vulgaris subsp. vulgaris]|uniref:UPF0481 protein At3g47200-like n=1 Tax=Beta vulgaris subsp. vulgaris TaxID=3555 RepID=UPI002036BBA7|nr:UPF0481 protein At3g47200-like [Beta vulgaris subsp. vulgaris]